MSATTLQARPWVIPASQAALKRAAQLWFLAAVVGQWLFLFYIVAFYGPTAMTGDFHAWTRNTMLVKGYVAGDAVGNLAFLAHALLAGVIAFGGALQLLPWLRTRAPALHRWNGRLFSVTAIGVGLSGLYLVWGRGGAVNLSSAVGVSLDGVLIVAFVALAWRSAWVRRIADHRRWALRAYIVANGQFFTRVGFVAWVIVNHGPKHMSSFFAFWSFGSYLLPLAVLELYLLARESGGPKGRFALASAIIVLTLLMGVGTLGFMGMMRPFLFSA